jgi:hypothetical protein
MVPATTLRKRNINLKGNLPSILFSGTSSLEMSIFFLTDDISIDTKILLTILVTIFPYRREWFWKQARHAKEIGEEDRTRGNQKVQGASLRSDACRRNEAAGV